ncbi:MAG: DMT family transporter [Conexivisphaerales archaeon]
MNNRLVKLFIPYVVIMSFQYQFAKQGLTYSSPYPFMALRYIIAGSLLLLMSRRLSMKRDTLYLALLTSISTLFWITGLEYVSPGDSAVISYSMPLFAAIEASIFLKEKVSVSEIAGIAVGFLGVALYSSTLQHGSLFLGVVLTLINSVFWGGFSVFMRKMRNEDTFSLVGSQFIIGSIPFLLLSIPYHHIEFSTNFIYDVLYVSILGGAVQLVIWDILLKADRVGRVTTYSFAVPALTVFVESVETLTPPSLIAVAGALVMFTGIAIANSSYFESKPKERKLLR